MTQSQPILMSGAMVRAVLREIEKPGTGKTQTRRLLKPQPPTEAQFPGSVFGMCRAVADGIKMFSQNDYERLPKHPRAWDLVGSVGIAREAGFPTKYDARFFPGQLLWVRETVRAVEGEDAIDRVEYLADGAQIEIANTQEAAERWLDLAHYRKKRGAKVSSIHMPRWASRLTLEVTAVKVERLQDISEEDAKAEGVEQDSDGWRDYLMPHTQCCASPADSFRTLRTSIHGPSSWEANPWIVAVSFKPHLRNIDQIRRDAE